MLSYEVVKKLNLKTFTHAAPYYATWVNENQIFLIKDQVMVEFSVGSYRGKVLCDVMHMTCGNLILGRSWQCSRIFMHNDYENTYVIQKGKVKYNLHPLVRSHKESILMCFGKDVPVQDHNISHYDIGWKQC